MKQIRYYGNMLEFVLLVEWLQRQEAIMVAHQESWKHWDSKNMMFYSKRKSLCKSLPVYELHIVWCIKRENLM